MAKKLIDLEKMGKYLQKLEWDKEDIEHAKQFINRIGYLSEEKYMEKDFEGLEEFEYFIANNNKILVPTIGQYSSGKSSLLNILIGEDYLPTSPGVCTNIGVIIEYSPNKNISELYKIEIEKSNKYFTLKNPKMICNDKTKIKETIDKINKENRPIKLEDSFLLLKVNIELFELFSEEKYKEKILLIDFPGLDVLEIKNFFISDVLSPLINQSDSFLFFNSEVINSDENQNIITKLVEKIKNRKISFSYQNCLFILNKWDIHRKKNNNNYSLNQAKNDLKDIFRKNQLDDIFNDIDIINCSAKDYKDFKKEINSILNFEEYIKNLKDNFEEDYELDDHDEDEDKNKQFYEFATKEIDDQLKKIKEISITQNNKDKKKYYLEKLEKILKDDFQLEDNKKNEIINKYISLINNIYNHELFIYSNKKELMMKIKQHIELSIQNMKKNIENKGINFFKNINNTISFVLKKLDNPKKNIMKYSKIEQSEKRKNEIEAIFTQFKLIIECQFQNYIVKEDKNINKYIIEINRLFINSKEKNNTLSNKIILGRIEKEKIDELKKNKKEFYDEMKNDFNKLIKQISYKIKTIKNDINIDENSFVQEYFETSDTTANNVNKSFIWEKIMSIFKFLGRTSWSEYILHKKILYDDRETIINKSIENFNLVKKQNKEAINDYIKVFIEQLDEFESNVKDEVQKMIDLSYTDFTKFTEDSKKIIIASANEFNEYIKKKYNRNNIIE